MRRFCRLEGFTFKAVATKYRELKPERMILPTLPPPEKVWRGGTAVVGRLAAPCWGEVAAVMRDPCME